MKKLLLFLLLANSLFARAVYTNWCQQGNGQILVSGITSSSTTPVQRSYPGCTVTVFLANGSTVATIYSDNSGTPKTNPFTLSGSQGLYSFFADTGVYVIRYANSGLTTFTFSVFLPSDFSSGGFISSLNGLTEATQTFAVGTSGTDFAISSATSTHTFNLPTASATNRGALSSSDWSTFNAKQSALTFTAPLVNTAGTVALTLPITIARGGCGEVTKAACFGALSPQTTKGDVIGYSTLPIRLAVGTNGQVLTAASGEVSGLIWSTPVNFWTVSGATIYNNTAISMCPGGTADACLTRNASGIVEVNSGVAGTFRDLKIRNGYQTSFAEWLKISTPTAATASTLRPFANNTTNRLDCINSAGTSCMPAGVNGSNVTSAATATLGVGNLFHVTGTVNITTLDTCDATTAGLTVTLVFDDILTFTDGNNLKLAGNFITSADDTITLVCDGANWLEVARSAN